MIHEFTLSSSFLRHTQWQEQAERNRTRQSKTEVRATQGGRKTGRGTGQNKDVYKYTANLQIALMFKDPLTSGSDWEGSPSSVVFNGIHECTKLMETRRLRPVVDTLRPVVKGAARTKFSYFPHRPHGVDGARKTKQGSISYKHVKAH